MKSYFLVLSTVLMVHFCAIGEEQKTFTEDFEKGADQWEPLGHEKKQTWRVEESDEKHGKVFHQFTNFGKKHGKHRSPFNIALLKDLKFTDFIFEARVKSTKKNYNHRDVCVFFGFQDTEHFYYVHFGLKTDNTSNRIMVVNDKPRVALGKPQSKGTPWTNDWHTIKIIRNVKEGTIKVFFDDMEKTHMEVVDKTFSWGQIGIGSFDDMAMWDDIKIQGKPYVAEAPKEK